MSKIALSGNVSGTGVLTIAAPNTNSDRTLTLPDESGTIISSGVSGVSGVPVGRGAGNVATNTAVGASALAANTTGASNTVVGSSAGYSNADGASLTAVGFEAGYSNTSGSNNVFMGRQAGKYTTTSSDNTGIGTAALTANTTGASNTAVGRQALQANTTASQNTAVGYQAGYAITTSSESTYVGYQAGVNSTGSAVTCLGRLAGRDLTTGTSNTFVGQNSGLLMTTGSKNTILGSYNGNQGGLDIRTASNYVVLSDGDGNPRLWLNQNGSLFVPQAYVDTTSSGANMVVRSDGLIYRSTSSLKYKTDVQDATHGLAEVMTLRPVTYKGNNDGDIVFGGLIAEEVHAAGLTEFVQYADDGTPDALAYGNMVSLAFKAIQELKSELDSVKAELATLKNN